METSSNEEPTNISQLQAKISDLNQMVAWFLEHGSLGYLYKANGWLSCYTAHVSDDCDLDHYCIDAIRKAADLIANAYPLLKGAKKYANQLLEDSVKQTQEENK